MTPARRQALDYFPGLKEHELPRYILLSDFQNFELYDLDIAPDRPVRFRLAELPDHVQEFGFIEDELEFFAREMQSRRVYLGPWRCLPFTLYGLFSNYGRSYGRPLAGLLVVAAIGAGAFWYFDACTPWEALGPRIC